MYINYSKFLSSNMMNFILFFLLFFTNQMNFRGSEFVPSGVIDFQVFIRLGVLITIFIFCLQYYKIFLLLLRQLPLALHAIFMVYILIISFAPDALKLYSLYALITHFMMFYIMVILVAKSGVDRSIYYYVISVAIFCFISLFMYYILPDIGHYSYIDHSGKVFTSARLSGIAGHPNTMGFMASSALLGFIHLFLKRYPTIKILYVGIIIISLCLIMTDNRSSLIGFLLVAVLYVTLHFRIFSIAVAIGCFLSILVIFYFMVFGISSEFLVIFSRSGNLSEITSLTGRSYIWSYMLTLIEQKPIFGWGYSTLGVILNKNYAEIGFHVGQAHNMYLHVPFTCCWVGLFLYIIAYCGTLYVAILKNVIKNRSAFELCLLLQLFISGFTETIMLSSICNNAYLIFVLSLASLSIFCYEHNSKCPNNYNIKF